jgi:hypothetical protein
MLNTGDVHHLVRRAADVRGNSALLADCPTVSWMLIG